MVPEAPFPDFTESSVETLRPDALKLGGQIPEHDETGSGQVELFIVLEGDAVMRLSGEEHAAPAVTFASIEPPASRTILNRSDAPVTALLIGVKPEGGYEPMSWG